MHISKSWLWTGCVPIIFQVLTFSRVIVAEQISHLVADIDIAIIGGGASGTYAAVRLREDYGKKVILIEKENVLGGHANTYSDSNTKGAFNYGVQSYIDYKGAKAFFQRFGIPLQPNVLFDSNYISVDPSTGAILPVPVPPLISNASIAALQKYYALIVPWNDITLPGYWNFPAGDQIPADLLLPFVDFVAKYGLEDMAPILSIVSGQSISTRNPTLYVVRNFGGPVVEGFLNNSFFDPNPFDLSILYSDAARLLGSDLVLNSTVVSSKRHDHGISLVVEDSRTGIQTHLNAKRLLIASQPSLDNLAVFGLDEQEKAVFSTWSYGTVYTAVLKTNLVPDNTSVTFTTPANSTSTKPYNFSITWNGISEYFWLIFGAQKNLSDNQVKEAIVSEMTTLYEGGAFPPIGSSRPSSEVVAISNHSSVTWGQSVEQLKAGFVQDLYALQGHKHTWYTGGLWCPDYSSNVWAFTDTVIPRLLENL